MYNNPYLSPYTPQNNVDKINNINNQIAELEMKKAQAYLPQPITQNFQIAPNSTTIKYANNIEEVQKEIVIGDTPYFSKDMTLVWIKNGKGEIKSYELNEIIQKDEKDMLIEVLMQQIDDLKKEKNINEQQNTRYVDGSTQNSKSSNGKSSSRSTKK